ncbi:MAG: sulfate ABC transporter permease subunit CysW [Magnetococcales bacterium]|nr:sulfate ABC transporter permease subunit CysW [Magnetococcales bacterium]
MSHGAERHQKRPSPVTDDPLWMRVLLSGLVVLFLTGFLLLPLLFIGTQALSKGFDAWLAALSHPDTLAALRLTLLTALIVVPLNLVFGLCVAWAVARHDFRGKNLLITLIDLPFAVSPVISGLIFVLLFGAQGWFAAPLAASGVKIIFAVPGIVLATLFVTLPFVAKELIPVMMARGRGEEEAARLLGASEWQSFWHVTLPGIRWGVLYGVILCNARAMGEFGAVSVVSGHIRGMTNTLPLHVENLYNEYQSVAAFAVSSILVGLSLLTLISKAWMDRRGREEPVVTVVCPEEERL